jgi:hypothetical protein
MRSAPILDEAKLQGTFSAAPADVERVLLGLNDGIQWGFCVGAEIVPICYVRFTSTPAG